MADETLGENGAGETIIAPHANGGQVTPPGTVQVAPIPTTAPKPSQAAKEPSPEDIGRSMGGGEAAKPKEANAPVAEQPAPFDLSMLRPEQLQQLKAMLNSTPDRITQKRSNPIIALRRFRVVSPDGSENLRIITDFRNAYETFVRDEIANITKEVVMIPVHFLGDEAAKFVNVPYKDFMNSDQIRCEVLRTRNEPGRIVEGEVLQRETGRIVEREIKTMDTWFTVKLPEGTTPAEIEIEAKIANG